jgi:hypothetical protein
MKQPKPKPEKVGILQSETVIINRSQINFAPYNPKRHTKELILKQLKNFKDIGFLGGICWNETTKNLISGHKRIMAFDVYYKYDGTSAIDYKVKVEKCFLTEKQEKEQNIFMDARSTNTSQDYGLLALILPDIDFKLAGLDANELNLISIESPVFDNSTSIDIKNDFKELSKDYDQKKQTIKEAKRKIKDEIFNNQGESYVTLTFDSYENKCEFMERFGFDVNLRFIKGESFVDLIEKIK